MGVSCLPRPCIADELKEGRLCELRIQGLDLQVPMSIMSHKLVRRSEMHAAFVDLVFNEPWV